MLLAVVKLSHKKLTMILALFQIALATVVLSNNLPVMITSNITDHDGTICYNQSMQLTCHAYSVNITQCRWTSTMFEQAKETASITVVATHDPIEYKCTVTGTDGESGYSSVNVSSNASTPELHAVTFYPEITVFADSYVNLTVKVANNLSLATISMWSKFNGALPKHSYIINYSKDGNNFTSFIIEKVSYYYDGGLYYLNASNLCGSSSISVVITVLRKDAGCFPSGQTLPLLNGSNDKTTVEGEMITFSCSFKGNYNPMNYGVYWIIKNQNYGNATTVRTDHNVSDYYVNTKKNCPFTNSSCCRFTTELSIHTFLSLNDAMITCNAIFVDSILPTSNTSTLMIIERPELIAGPANATGVKEHESVHFECHFNASMIPYLALCGWKKDADDVNNGEKSQPVFENQVLICRLTINSASAADEGNYICYCYYNNSFREQYNFENITSQYGKAELQLKRKNHNLLSSDESIGIFVAVCVIATILTIILVGIVIWCVVSYHRTRQAHSVDGGSGTESNDGDNSGASSESPLLPSQQSTESQSTDNSSHVSIATAESEDDCILHQNSPPYPIEQQEDDPSTIVTPSHQFDSGNIQTREAANVSKLIEIITEPKDQIIQFKDIAETTVKLNCYAKSNGNTLCYEWYHDDSDEIISKNSYAELKLNRPPKNTEKQCYCKISIANQPEHYVKSKRALIKLDIVWFTEQPMSTRVFTGRNLELSCKAEAAPGINIEYHWSKHLKKDGSQKSSTVFYIGNRMMLTECNDASGGYYSCEVVATDQVKPLCKINSMVAHIKVVNSTNISITRQPPLVRLVTFGEELTLECEASCKHHPVKYQWYNKAKPVAGATQSVLTIPSVQGGNTGPYHCIVSSDYSEASVVSRMTQLKVNYSSTWNQSQCNQVEAEQHLIYKNRIYARDKMALLIGNSNYEAKPLRCPKNDVKELTERLQQLNFKTISLVDLTLSQMISAVEYFCSLLDKGMYAIFYYSGHGVEVNKTTYFVPVEADEENLTTVHYNNSDLIAYKLQSTLAKVIMVLDCCRKIPPKKLQMPAVQFNENFSMGTICKIYACASSFEAVEMYSDENSFMTKALLQALDCSEKKQLCNDLYKHIVEYYATHNVPTQGGQSFIRPEMKNSLSVDLSLDDPILPSSSSKARDLLLAIPRKCSLNFNHPTMKITYGSISLHFEAVYSNVIMFHVCCDAAKQPTLKDVKLSHSSGLYLKELKTEGIASYEINNLLMLMDLAERGESYPKLQFTFQMPQDANVMDQIEYKIPSDLISSTQIL